jgi:hypothetical protein
MERIQERLKEINEVAMSNRFWTLSSGEHLNMIDALTDDVEYLLAENKRLTEGWNVMANIPMHMHPSDIKQFAKRMLKGEKPFALNE